MKVELVGTGTLIEYGFNNRIHPQEQIDRIANSIRDFGFNQPIVVDENNVLLVGHGRLAAARKLGLQEVPVVILRDLTETQKRAYRILDNKLSDDAEWDTENLRLELDRLIEDGYEFEKWGLDDFSELLPPEEKPTEEDDFDPTIEQETFLKLGDLIELGEHRVLCGDSTDPKQVEYLLNNQMATLIHADPPYGMGKEKDGVANDNLYADKLDDFQMKWWRAWRPYIIDNGSAYIWGNPEDLWRLWFVGGLGTAGNVTLRNEIVWNKSCGMGQNSDSHRQYATATERCLFFMLGNQGFNNNSDNYWEGWEPIRFYLAEESKRMAWGTKDLNHATGTQMGSHWITKSQWLFPTEENYAKLQSAANGKAFAKNYEAFAKNYEELKREYEELKQEFYGSRAYFNNTHENMTDVWDYPRVTGEERHGHATPKPVKMMARCIRSSSREGDLVVEPFLGSGSTLIAAEQVKRRCYGMELSPNYCQIILNRFIEFTSKNGAPQEIKINGEVFDVQGYLAQKSVKAD